MPDLYGLSTRGLYGYAEDRLLSVSTRGWYAGIADIPTDVSVDIDAAGLDYNVAASVPENDVGIAADESVVTPTVERYRTLATARKISVDVDVA